MFKDWYKSLGVNASTVIIVAVVANLLFGFDVSSLLGVDPEAVGGITKETAAIIDKLIVLAAAIGALYGRLRATTQIKGFRDPGGRDTAGG